MSDRVYYRATGCYTSKECFASECWDYEKPSYSITMAWSSNMMRRLARYASPPYEEQLPRLNCSLEKWSMTKAGRLATLRQMKRIAARNRAKFTYWHDFVLPKTDALVRLTLESFAQKHVLSLPLGYETRSHMVTLTFRYKLQAELWTTVKEDVVFGERREWTREKTLVKPLARSSRKLPRLADGQQTKVFEAGHEIFHHKPKVWSP